MLTVIITLLIISTLLFISSFFASDRFKSIETQLEQLSLNQMQEAYQLKKKIKILEEELMPEELDFNFTSQPKSPLQSRVEALYENGKSISQISQITQLSAYDIEILINQLIKTR